MGHHWPYVPAGSLVERHPPPPTAPSPLPGCSQPGTDSSTGPSILLELPAPLGRGAVPAGGREHYGEQTAGPGRDMEPRQSQGPVRSTACPSKARQGGERTAEGPRGTRGDEMAKGTEALRAGRESRLSEGGNERRRGEGDPGAWGPRGVRGVPEGVCRPRYSRGG